MATMNSQDAISAKAGKVFMTFGAGANRVEIAELVKLEATIEFTKADVDSIGRYMKGNKVVGAEGKGSFTMHFIRPELRRMAVNYVKEGIAPVFSIQADNADVTSKAGRQSVLLKNVVPDQTLITRLDASSDEVVMDEADFTFDELDMLDEFGLITETQ